MVNQLDFIIKESALRQEPGGRVTIFRMSTSIDNSIARAFAILPAAGESLRMGEDKLLLPWGGHTVIESVISAWQQSGVEAIVAVVSPQNKELIARLIDYDLHLLVPNSPPVEMKHSVQLALEVIESTYRPSQRDLWLLAPADMPRLSSVVAREVIELALRSIDEITVPVHAGRRGHPAAFRWDLAKKAYALATDEGVNALFRRHTVREVDFGPAAIPDDIDTPEDYQRLLDEGV